jgi:hypothetical protein
MTRPIPRPKDDFARFGDFKALERQFPMEDRIVNAYGEPPIYLGHGYFDLSEVMYYLYLPVAMGGNIHLPPNIECCRPLIKRCLESAPRSYAYAYISARKGWATPDNPLNRPGWHCDGFGTDDMNFVWWVGPGTRFAIQPFSDISSDHVHSLRQFEMQVTEQTVESYPERGLYALTPYVVHATPLIEAPGCMRQYVKISLSDHQYNLENNSHNYLFDYDWPMNQREIVRNDTHAAQKDFTP